MIAQTEFDPARHLTLVSGKEYLEVKWRLVWLRTQHPDAVIETDLISHEGNLAVFKATVSIPNGGSATGWGSEDAQGFGDYLEKAETKSIGRALAALGFGTQFCSDFDFGSGVGRVVDAPVQFRSVGSSPVVAERVGGYEIVATDRQVGLIRSLGRDLKLNAKALDDLSQELTGSSLEAITRRDASTLIESLKARSQTKVAESA